VARKPFDERTQESYLKIYALTGRVHDTARSLEISPGQISALRRKDPEFDRKCKEAYGLYQDRLEEEALNRAVIGWEEPVYFQGKVVGTVRKKSDRILELMLKKAIPSYRDKAAAEVNMTGGVLVVPAVSPDAETWQKQFRTNGEEQSED